MGRSHGIGHGQMQRLQIKSVLMKKTVWKI